MRPEELKKVVPALREIGLSYEESVSLLRQANVDTKSLKSIWGKPNAGGHKSSQLIKLGVSLIAFPIPTIGIKKSLGLTLIAAGLAKERMKHLHMADVYTVFQDINKELQKLPQNQT